MLSFTRILLKNDMGTSELQFIFGQDLFEASWKCGRNFFNNGKRENMSILDQGYKPP